MYANGVSHSLVDSPETVLSLVQTVRTLPTDEPSLYLDLEGVSLSRYGSISIITIYVLPQKHVYLVDVHNLQSVAFTTATAEGTTLKSILESPTITKVFFDVRNDSDALYHHFGVRLCRINDVQLMENAVRPPGRRRYLFGLDKCINTYGPLSSHEKLAWKTVKDKGLQLFHPSKGGSYQVFNTRPINPDIERYCINDVQFLPELRTIFLKRLNKTWMEKVQEETEKRVKESHGAAYEPQSDSKKFGPWETLPQQGLQSTYWR